LQEARLKINAVKSFFAQTNLEYLCCKHWQRRPLSITKVNRSNTTNQSTNNLQTTKMLYRHGKLYYPDMWPLRLHLLALLSSMTSAKVKWKWTPECQDSFEKMKAIVAKESFVTFLGFTKDFEIPTDASKLQLGAYVSQGGKPVAV
jgi:hypothetical protein